MTAEDEGTDREALTEEQRRVLEYEKTYREQGRPPWLKEQAVHSDLGMEPSRYVQVLTQLADHREALRADPVTVRALQRLRDQRARQRRGGPVA
jgi:hypothetical protein